MSFNGHHTNPGVSPMSQQHTKAEKRARAKRYAERVKERIKEAKSKKK